LFGIIALVLAVIARSTEKSGQYDMAKKLGKASFLVSIVGIVVGVISGAIYLGLTLFGGDN
jgi:cobalamin synthase